MADDSKTYTVGFMFTKDRKHVAVVKKNRPEWQAGKWNGVGGHFDPALDLTPNHTQAREFYEETGIMTNPHEWEAFATLWGNVHGPSADYVVSCYRTFNDDAFSVRTKTDEEVHCITLELLLDEPHIPNLAYLIPLALSTEKLNNQPSFTYARKPVKR